MFSFQTLLKGTFSLLTCHLQFSITARVSMTLKRQSVQSLSDQTAARTFCVSQGRGIVKRMVWSKTKCPLPLVWSRWRLGGEWVRLRREVKNTSEKYDRNWKRKNKRKKTRKEKEWQFRSLEGVEKLVLPNPFPRWSITKRQKCSTLKLNTYHKNLEMKDVDNL